MKTTNEILLETREALKALNKAREKKNSALNHIAERLISETDSILEANKIDIDNAREKYGSVMLDRLTLNEKRIADMAQGVRDVACLPDPEGRVLSRVERPNGLIIEKISVPLGLIAIIYESRPNVTSDAAVLALKSGNAVVLRGGSEAFYSNQAIVKAIRLGLEDAGLPKELVGFIEDTSHQSADELMKAVGLVDLLIPRGGAGLIKRCVENALVPCIHTGTGICHIYVDESADFETALNIIENAKTSRPSVCNAAEVLLVNGKIAEKFLPLLRERLVTEREGKNLQLPAGLPPVELRLDSKAINIIEGTPAKPDDFDTEFLDYILAVAVVNDTESAINHIARHSTGHSEAIITQTPEHAEMFTSLVDSAAVYVNASTRFTDGGEFGLGCEMGISTQKLHARGPMGLEELNTYKYVIHGNGQTR